MSCICRTAWSNIGSLSIQVGKCTDGLADGTATHLHFDMVTKGKAVQQVPIIYVDRLRKRNITFVSVPGRGG